MSHRRPSYRVDYAGWFGSEYSQSVPSTYPCDRFATSRPASGAQQRHPVCDQAFVRAVAVAPDTKARGWE